MKKREKTAPALTYTNKECSLCLQLNNNALYWCDTASVFPTKATTLKVDCCVFKHTQQKYHIEVQSPQTSKNVLINLLPVNAVLLSYKYYSAIIVIAAIIKGPY